MSELTNYNAAIYVRLSKEDEDASDGRKKESNSITNQLQMLRYNAKETPCGSTCRFWPRRINPK